MMTWLLIGSLSCRNMHVGGVNFPRSLLADDFVPRGTDLADLQESRLDGVRTPLGHFEFEFPEGPPIIDDSQGEGGAIMAIGRPGIGVSAARLLGPYVVDRYQPTLQGFEVNVGNAQGDLLLELLDAEGETIWSSQQRIGTSAYKSYRFATNPSDERSFTALKWTVDGFMNPVSMRVGFAEPSEGYASVEEEAFLYSFGVLSRCWNPDLGLVALRCNGVDEEYGVDVTGLFALAAAVGSDLGYVDGGAARDIVVAARQAVLETVPVHPQTGLMPAKLVDGAMADGSYYSTLSTVLGLESLILASEAFSLSTGEMEFLLESIDWDELTGFGATPISVGANEDGEIRIDDLGVFGSKSTIAQMAYAGATGELAEMVNEGFSPTLDGSGYDNELAALLFPMVGTDPFGNSWHTWRDGAFFKHIEWMVGTPAEEKQLFGISASEVPEIWNPPSSGTSGEWGVGGYNAFASDGFNEVGYTILAPHYVAMTVGEHPYQAEPMLQFLLDNGFLGPLNAVDSLGVVDGGAIRYNHHVRAFPLAMQTLGLGRALSGENYLPYRLLGSISWLEFAGQIVLPAEDNR